MKKRGPSSSPPRNAFDVLMKRGRPSSSDVAHRQSESNSNDAKEPIPFIEQERNDIGSNADSDRTKQPKGLNLPRKTPAYSRISGLRLLEDVLNNGDSIIRKLVNSPGWKPVSTYKDSRQVLHYGYEYSYGTKTSIEKTPTKLPSYLEPLREMAKEVTRVEFDQCLVNRYLPGQGISKHIDKLLFGDTVACFSLGSSAVIVFRNPATGESVDVLIPENSLYIMQGDARYVWTHEMPGRLKDHGTLRGTRYSVTFRRAL